MARRAAREDDRSTNVEGGALPAEALAASFPDIDLPIRPPFPPMEAAAVAELPAGPGWLYKPKWDGFRCLAFRAGERVLLQSKVGQPLGRYFPELVEALGRLPAPRFVLLVCEVRYDHFSGDRFRHGTKFLRWRPDNAPSQCTLDQVRPAASGAAQRLLGV